MRLTLCFSMSRNARSNQVSVPNPLNARSVSLGKYQNWGGRHIRSDVCVGYGGDHIPWAQRREHGLSQPSPSAHAPLPALLLHAYRYDA